MKKIIAILLILAMSPVLTPAGEIPDGNKIALNKPLPIEDEFIKSDKFPKIMPVYVKDDAPITDELIESFEQTGQTIKLWARKRGEYQKVDIQDELVTNKFRDKAGAVSILKRKQKQNIEDEFVKNTIDLKNVTVIKAKNCYDFTKAQIPVQLKIIKNLTTKNDILEGDSILFKTVKDVMINGVNFPKGTKIVGRVETVSESDKMGTPANIVIDNFYVKNNPEINFYGNISKTGANRALWVYPLYQAGNLVLYVAGFVFVPIHGGHAKLSTNEVYTVFYETH